MTAPSQTWCVAAIAWWLRRNPLYLLSAACMAVGARLCLVRPGTPAGDLGVILATLGVLQAYEWAVTGLLVLLQRVRRAPEDRCSLLLVAALFWTGPIAATIELTARQPRHGLLAAVAVALFALAELFVVRRSLGLLLSLPARVLAAVCLGILVIAPWHLHVRNGDHTDELFLYACWWLLAGAAALGVACVRYHAARAGNGPLAARHADTPVAGGGWGAGPDTDFSFSILNPRSSTRFRDAGLLGCGALVAELVFVAVVVAATATHLTAMNYVFLGHARNSYAAPLLLAAMAVGFELAAHSGRVRGWVGALALALLPAALAGASVGVHPSVPVHLLPAPLRDPLLSALGLGTVALGFGTVRLRSVALFHAASLAAACTAWRARQVLWPSSGAAASSAATTWVSNEVAALVLLSLAAYLLAVAGVRRSRLEAILGLVVTQPAAWIAVWPYPTIAPFLIGTVACWSVLAVMHLGAARPAVARLLWPIAALLLLDWCYDADAALQWSARANSLLLVGALLAFGHIWELDSYRRLGIGTLVASVAFWTTRVLAVATIPSEVYVVTLAFGLLGGGALVSWHKRAWLRLLVARRAAPVRRFDDDGTTGVGASGTEA